MLDVVTGAPEWHVEPQQARIDGIVESIAVKSVIVNGEIDARSLPSVSGRVKLSVFGSASDDSTMLSDLAGSRIVVFGVVRRPTLPWYPGQFDEESYARSHGIIFIGLCDRGDIHVRESAALHTRVLSEIRLSVSNTINTTFAPDVAPFMHALLVGDTRQLDSETKISFSNAGTSHVLAVSGMHVTLIVWLLLVVSGGKPKNPISLIIIICIIVMYVVITGAEPPAVRAGLMCIAALCGKLFQRDVDALNLLGGSVLVQILVEPAMMFNHGFILSTCATVSILSLGFGLRTTLLTCIERRTHWKAGLVNIMSVNLSATAGVALPAALLYGQAPVYSPLTNFFVVPLFSAALILGVLAVALCSLLPDVVGILPIPFLPEFLIRGAVKIVDVAAFLTPDVSRPTSVLLAIGTMIAIVWITHSITVRAILSKVTISTALIAFCMLVSQTNVSHLVMSPVRNGLHLFVAGESRQRVVLLHLRNGGIAIRAKQEAAGR